MATQDTQPETDTIFSRGRLYPWIVSVDGEPHITVLADTAGHTCARSSEDSISIDMLSVMNVMVKGSINVLSVMRGIAMNAMKCSCQ